MPKGTIYDRLADEFIETDHNLSSGLSRQAAPVSKTPFLDARKKKEPPVEPLPPLPPRGESPGFFEQIGPGVLTEPEAEDISGRLWQSARRLGLPIAAVLNTLAALAKYGGARNWLAQTGEIPETLGGIKPFYPTPELKAQAQADLEATNERQRQLSAVLPETHGINTWVLGGIDPDQLAQYYQEVATPEERLILESVLPGVGFVPMPPVVKGVQLAARGVKAAAPVVGRGARAAGQAVKGIDWASEAGAVGKGAGKGKASKPLPGQAAMPEAAQAAKQPMTKEGVIITREWLTEGGQSQYSRRLNAAVDAPWMLRGIEYDNISQPSGSVRILKKNIDEHKRIVRQALSEGKPVPPEVLADYPDLAKAKAPEAPPVTDVDTAKAEVARLQAEQAALQKRVNAMPKDEYKKQVKALDKEDARLTEAIDEAEAAVIDAGEAAKVPEAAKAKPPEVPPVAEGAAAGEEAAKAGAPVQPPVIGEPKVVPISPVPRAIDPIEAAISARRAQRPAAPVDPIEAAIAARRGQPPSGPPSVPAQPVVKNGKLWLPEPPRDVGGFTSFTRKEHKGSFKGKVDELDTVEQAHQMVLKSREMGENAVPYVMSYIRKIGDVRKEFGLTKEGMATAVNNPENRSLAINDILSNYTHYALTPKQKELAIRSGEVYRQALELAQSYGVKINELGNPDEMWQYIARRVKGVKNPATGEYEIPPGGVGGFKMGAKISAQKERQFEEMLQGVDLGFLYENPDQVMTSHIKGIYRLIGNKQAEELVKPLTRQITEAAPLRFGERAIAEPALQFRAANREIANAIDKIFTPEQAWEPIKKLADIGGAIVGHVASMDISAPFIQGLPLLSNDIKNGLRLKPTANWAKAYGKMVQTIINPENINNYRMANQQLYKEMIEAGVMTGKGEFVEQLGIVERGLYKVSPKAAGAYKQTWGRFGQAYSDFLEVARVEYFKTMKEPWLRQGGDIYDLGGLTNRMTGATSAAARGVHVNRRLAERAVAFAPNYIRSSLLLFQDMAQGGVKAKEAFTTIATMLGVGTAIYYAEEKARGKEPKMKPWPKRLGGDGAEAFTTEIAGQRVGFGSWQYGMIKTAAEIGAVAVDNPGQLIKLNDKHPLVRFIRTKRSPLVSLTWELAEGKTFWGKDYDGPEDYLLRLAETLIPISGQDLIEKKELGIPKTAPEVLTNLGANALGMRAFPYGLRSQWADEGALKEYEAIPVDPIELKAAQKTNRKLVSRLKYRQRNPDVDAKLFLIGDVNSLTTGQAVNQALKLIRELDIDPDSIKGIARRKELREIAKEARVPMKQNAVDQLIRRLNVSTLPASTPAPTPVQRGINPDTGELIWK